MCADLRWEFKANVIKGAILNINILTKISKRFYGRPFICVLAHPAQVTIIFNLKIGIEACKHSQRKIRYNVWVQNNICAKDLFTWSLVIDHRVMCVL